MYIGGAVVGAVVVGVAAGPASARPLECAAETSAIGTDQGVEYRAELAASGQVLTTALTGGMFELAADGSKVLVRSDRGAIVAEVPLTFELDGRTLTVAGDIAADGRKLTLAPSAVTAEIGEMQPVSSMARLIAELEKSVVGMVAGAVLGGIVGAVLGLGFLSLLTGPIGMVVGAVAGGYVMGGQSFSDAALAVLSGQP